MSIRPFLVLLLACCHGAPSPAELGVPTSSPASPGVAGDAPPGPARWQESFDLDGDGREDRIDVEFTGGAHCCYRLRVELTSAAEPIDLPFEVDGGYVGGLDLSRPDHFDVRRVDGPLPELLMDISTYGSTKSPIPVEWKQRYGISTHRVAVGFAGGRLRVRDAPHERRGSAP